MCARTSVRLCNGHIQYIHMPCNLAWFRSCVIFGYFGFRIGEWGNQLTLKQSTEIWDRKWENFKNDKQIRRSRGKWLNFKCVTWQQRVRISPPQNWHYNKMENESKFWLSPWKWEKSSFAVYQKKRWKRLGWRYHDDCNRFLGNKNKTKMLLLNIYLDA